MQGLLPEVYPAFRTVPDGVMVALTHQTWGQAGIASAAPNAQHWRACLARPPHQHTKGGAGSPAEGEPPSVQGHRLMGTQPDALSRTIIAPRRETFKPRASLYRVAATPRVARPSMAKR
ncbi:MAG: hypothetical protein A2087_00495 [Spirochaetes bacterium GWD1_61_31]|nr:MAG: hypothetical protein A2Y37_00460 [Spirochaetes bacterium GWB1_60_80]OHD28939.1 MAG: hypothetical protein A2004_10940 [Spirochaetes bacterium GWC1_61_12]OHD39127.1 MAG: hypothetical protein A2087_00495 [Spirochaetes bacterium GWD1_61_31]OHD43526.1 MAG: hypothetical protein A2Y35_04600 [Spirochaetes bacterium GWE1_60_18]OHD58993.1 MAG: hypothetical protein A2Y32_01795 [Spirochaetes bacterium GWF1_60_12]HCQ86805.1 hypothetical protein [Spirochaetaceae bacterium]